MNGGGGGGGVKGVEGGCDVHPAGGVQGSGAVTRMTGMRETAWGLSQYTDSVLKAARGYRQ